MVDFSHFRDWVASQSSRKQYEYGETGGGPDFKGMRCALGQYLADLYPGSDPRVYIGYAMTGDVTFDIPYNVELALQGDGPGYKGARQTFGGLAKRLAQLDLVA